MELDKLLHGIDSLRKLVLSLSDETLNELTAMSQRQLNYFSPLRPATQSRTNKAGAYNMKVIEGIKNLREAFLSYKPKTYGA
jgi:hypothetical protein